jgi:hypothetical protein
MRLRNIIGDSMNKSDLITALSARENLTEADASRIIINLTTEEGLWSKYQT